MVLEDWGWEALPYTVAVVHSTLYISEENIALYDPSSQGVQKTCTIMTFGEGARSSVPKSCIPCPGKVGRPWHNIQSTSAIVYSIYVGCDRFSLKTIVPHCRLNCSNIKCQSLSWYSRSVQHSDRLCLVCARSRWWHKLKHTVCTLIS